ncbi:MAG: metal ABC transporter ATP-binding protein [Bacteroidota bacterium]
MIQHVKDPIIETHNLTVSYNANPVLWNIDFTLPAGELTGIIGPNGSGKTTLLKSIMGLVPLSSGFVKIFGQSLENVRDKISYVPQRETVDWDFPASVLDVVLMGRYSRKNILRSLSREDHSIAQESLEKVGMQDFAKRQISQLSGGQQQRVFIARALARQSSLFLLDEPFTGVDAASEESILNLLIDMKKEGKSIVVVHHDLHTAKAYFDWIVLLNTRLVASGPKEDIFNTELLQEAYGGRLTLLSKVGDLLKQESFPIREK